MTMTFTKFSTIFGLAVGLAAAAVGPARAETQFITIGTGGVTGVYYPLGGAICRLVNKDRKTQGIRCSVESTGASVYNARAIRNGELDFGVVQSDVQVAAIEGVGRFAEDGPNPDLRAMFSIHPEPMQLMARLDSGIGDIKDLKGKRVNIANPGSGSRAMAGLIMDYAGVGKGDFALASELKSSEQASALCDGKIEAAFWVAGLPNGSTMEAASTCAIKLIPLSGGWVDKLLAGNKAYAHAIIPGGMYPGNESDVATFGPKATIVTSAKTSDKVAYAVTKAVFDNFEAFKKLHPAFSRLVASEMVVDGLSAPLHPGALKYYKERGWK